MRQNGAISLAGTVTRDTYLDLEIAYSYPSDVAGVISLNRYETSRRAEGGKKKEKEKETVCGPISREKSAVSSAGISVNDDCVGGWMRNFNC